MRTLLLSVILCIVCANAQIRGLWYWTWSSNVQVGNSNLGVAFSGWVDPDKAISDSSKILSKLPGDKYISLGGGNNNGHWTASVLQKISTYCSQKKFSGYKGIAFDVEEGDSGLGSAFEHAFSSCKAGGYKVLVTVSHSAPYGISDAANLMASFFSSHNIDYFSPQLYSTGTEGSNDYSDPTVSWSKYAGKNLIPSVVSGSNYAAAKSYFAGKGITTQGYVQWSQTVTSSSSSSPSSGSSSSSRCGPSWVEANKACGASCKTNADCKGSYCWANLNSCTAHAMTENSNTFTEATPLTGNELTPIQIGFIIGGCVVFAIVVVVVALVVNRNKKQEEHV